MSHNRRRGIPTSYLEVYNERVRDLLRPSSSSIGLKVREHPRLGPYVQGLTHHAVPTLGSLISRVEEGTRARKTASTLQNPTSSRSHALLTLSLLPSTSNIGQSVTDTTATTRNVPHRKEHFPRGSKLHLVDLAGSESAAACGGINRLKEGANINKSLVALGNVISALAERGSTGSGPGRRFIPYRDSALTWLLKDALGGNATTIMLATISPASGSYNETSHTLRFAQRAQSVVNRPVINEDPVSRIIRELRAEVARLKSLLVEKNVNPDCKSICLCQLDREREIKVQDRETREIDPNEPAEERPEDEEEYEVSIEARYPTIPERRHSTSESLLSRKKLSSPVRRFGSFEIVRESRNSSLESIEADNYNRAKVSELIINDEVNEPVFIDIPTLVAVLIKPDDNIHVGDHQIEEIGSDGVPESVTDVEFSENVDRHNSAGNNEFQDFQCIGTQAEDIKHLDNSECLEVPQKVGVASGESTNHQCGKGKLQKHDSIDADFTAKVSSNLQTSKKYGSIENLPRKREITCSLQRSHTNLDKRNGSLDKIKKLNNIKEVDDQRSSKSFNSWRNLGAWANRDFQRKGSNDSDKSLKDSAIFARSKNQSRKQSIDGLRRKTSKDSSSSSSKDELLVNGGQTREKLPRKGSLEQEHLPTKLHTPIQRARRAEIVAAVTERLYSKKKFSEDNGTTLTGNTTLTSTSDILSPENTDVKLASATRMRLQEISRKMLAKRRRICVDTQTDNQQTVRLRDASSITEEPKIVRKDASILTDRHEDYDILPFVDCPVMRVKEMSTLTDKDLQQRVIRCKDAANVTDDYYEDYPAMNSPRNDSGIMSDDTQNYAESNLSSTEISDLSPIGGRRSREVVENSTNTRLPSCSPNSGSQTRREDLVRARCSNCDVKCCGGTRHCHEINGSDRSDNNQTCHRAERNVISISLPDMLSITIETSNGMESKIKVSDGNESIDERAIVSSKDNAAQTDKKDALEIGTSTDDIVGQVCFHDFSISSKPIIGQTDGKTFRIENIFHEPHGVTRINPRIEIVGNSSKDAATTNSFIVTNSIGTSFVPETRENATCMERGKHYSSRMFLEARRSLTNEGLIENRWPSRWRSCSPNSRRQSCCQGYSMLVENQRSQSTMSMGYLDGKYNMDNDEYMKKEDQFMLGSNKKYLDEITGRKDPKGRGKLDQDFLETSGEDTSVIVLKSPSNIAILDRKGSFEQETNFSDDSLDLAEDVSDNDDDSGQLVIDTSTDRIKVAATTMNNEKACPPDLVAHTKKETNNSAIPIDRSVDEFEDFDDESQQIDFPKTRIDATTGSSFATPMSNFKTLILGDPCYTVNHADDTDLTDFENESSTGTLIDDDDYCCSSIDVVEAEEQCLMNGGHSIAPKSIIKKAARSVKNPSLFGECQTKCVSKNLGNGNSSRKKVHFAIPEVIEWTSSDSELRESVTSDDEIVEQRSRTILEEYLDEAVVFMRNMNSMNEYMSAACGSDKCTINGRNRRRGRAKSANYIEYEGRRISLEDDTDKCVKSDDDDLDFNVESYDKCLKSMDKLEECLDRVRRHDETLRENYGIGKDGSTGAKLNLAKFSIDSNHSNRDLSDVDKFDDSGITRYSDGNRVIVSKENIDDGNNNAQLQEEQGKDFASENIDRSENLKKSRTRRLCRFSDLRKRNPTTYSQLRNKYGSRSVDAETKKKDNVSSPAVSIEPSKVDESAETILPDSLRTPDCFLILPNTTRNDEGPSNGIKTCTPRRRFSLSKYDSSNESSSSNEALATFMESIDNVARSRDKFKYSSSPRAKFLQLLSERRRIVENTRSTGAS